MCVCVCVQIYVCACVQLFSCCNETCLLLQHCPKLSYSPAPFTYAVSHHHTLCHINIHCVYIIQGVSSSYKVSHHHTSCHIIIAAIYLRHSIQQQLSIIRYQYSNTSTTAEALVTNTRIPKQIPAPFHSAAALNSAHKP